MKKVLLAVMLLVFATPVFAADAYVALYADAGRSDCDVLIVGGFMPFEVWVWFSSWRGVQAAEYKLTAPAGVIASTVTTNPDINVTLGDPWSGIAVSFQNCQTGWVWAQHVACYLTVASPAFILVEASPTAGALQIASCELGYPLFPAAVVNHLALNQGCVVATENASWGAIKSLF